jgi:hypothetical protein
MTTSDFVKLCFACHNKQKYEHLFQVTKKENGGTLYIHSKVGVHTNIAPYLLLCRSLSGVKLVCELLKLCCLQKRPCSKGPLGRTASTDSVL